jgi:nucleotide-binding universal stress UspA family protein
MTDFKQVLVHLDASDTAGARLHAARSIADRAGAAVAALYAAFPAYLDVAYAYDLAPGLVEGLAEIDASRLADARGAFDDEMRSEGPAAVWSEATDIPVVDAFVQQALYADLLVLGQENPSCPAPGVPQEFAQSVIIASGKPALLIPHIGWNRGVGEIAVIAWKESRESARAVAYALPLLRYSREVHVLAWDESRDSPVRGQRLDLRRFLHQHGVEVEWHAGESEPKLIGQMMLSRAFDLDADLLVMGCYGHSRARELVLGGASRTVLRSMTLPVLMAH